MYGVGPKRRSTPVGGEGQKDERYPIPGITYHAYSVTVRPACIRFHSIYWLFFIRTTQSPAAPLPRVRCHLGNCPPRPNNKTHTHNTYSDERNSLLLLLLFYFYYYCLYICRPFLFMNFFFYVLLLHTHTHTQRVIIISFCHRRHWPGKTWSRSK